jgi:hypothetical protein
MAIDTEVKVVNLSLYLIGEGSIASLTDDSKPANVANLMYSAVRDEVLRRHEWVCAVERQTLAAGTEDTLSDFEYAYQLPTDPYCLRVLELLDWPEETPRKIEGRQILCNVPTSTGLSIRYIKRVTDPGEFDSVFVWAVVYRLAFQMSQALTGEFNPSFNAMYEQQVNLAITLDKQEAEPKVKGSYKSVTGRFG